MPGMAIALMILGTAFAAFCVWLVVRVSQSARAVGEVDTGGSCGCITGAICGEYRASRLARIKSTAAEILTRDLSSACIHCGVFGNHDQCRGSIR
jgi:hypothetical protein